MRHGADGVSELTGYGDEIDVVALVDILKQIFKTPSYKTKHCLTHKQRPITNYFHHN
jgi:hypothetical protein